MVTHDGGPGERSPRRAAPNPVCFGFFSVVFAAFLELSWGLLVAATVVPTGLRPPKMPTRASLASACGAPAAGAAVASRHQEKAEKVENRSVRRRSGAAGWVVRRRNGSVSSQLASRNSKHRWTPPIPVGECQNVEHTVPHFSRARQVRKIKRKSRLAHALVF